jgi:hypothetical protein
LRPKKFINIVEFYNEVYDTSDVFKFPNQNTSLLDGEEDFIEF